MNRLAIVGASGHGKVVAEAALLSGWQSIVFYDDSWPDFLLNSHWQVSGNMESLLGHVSEIDGVIVAIGDNCVRQKKSQMLKAQGFSLVSVIHPSAIVSQHAVIGEGCFIGASAVLQVDAKIDSYAIVNTRAVVEHDCHIKEAGHVSPGASIAGNVSVGLRAWIGIGSSIRQQIVVADDAVVGAGSVVVKDIPCGVTVIGNPAKQVIK